MAKSLALVTSEECARSHQVGSGLAAPAPPPAASASRIGSPRPYERVELATADGTHREWSGPQSATERADVDRCRRAGDDEVAEASAAQHRRLGEDVDVVEDLADRCGGTPRESQGWSIGEVRHVEPGVGEHSTDVGDVLRGGQLRRDATLGEGIEDDEVSRRVRP